MPKSPTSRCSTRIGRKLGIMPPHWTMKEEECAERHKGKNGQSSRPALVFSCPHIRGKEEAFMVVGPYVLKVIPC